MSNKAAGTINMKELTDRNTFASAQLRHSREPSRLPYRGVSTAEHGKGHC